MRFIDDDQVGGCAQEVVSSVFGLDEVGGDDGDPVAVEDRFVLCEAPFQASDGSGKDQLGFEAELGGQFLSPLLREAGWAQDRQALSGSGGKQF